MLLKVNRLKVHKAFKYLNMSRRDPVLSAFGRNVRRRRETLDLTQEGLAEKAGLDRSYISNVERGSRNLSLSSIVRIAKALRTTASDLCRDVH
jgi:predicted transcriptional regulator